MEETAKPALTTKGGDDCLSPVSSQKWMAESRNYILSNPSYDIGEYLEKINIKSFQIITITLKKGIYKWDKLYSTPESCKIYLIGEDFENGGTNNKVTIVMTEKSVYTYENKKYSENVRLKINDDSKVVIEGIDLIEKINDSRELTPRSPNIGVFTVNNSVFQLKQCRVEMSTSPFINFQAISIGKVIFGHTWFVRNPFANKEKICIVGTKTGWDFRGNKGYVSTSFTHVNNDCFFEKNPKIEYID